MMDPSLNEALTDAAALEVDGGSEDGICFRSCSSFRSFFSGFSGMICIYLYGHVMFLDFYTFLIMFILLDHIDNIFFQVYSFETSYSG